MNVGCFTGSVSFTDSPSFVTSKALFVGDSASDAYVLAQPTANRAYCTIQSNEIVNTDGSSQSPIKINQCTTQPCSSFDLVSTALPDSFSFKVKTTFTNNLAQFSPVASMSLTCSSAYAITASTTNTIQYITHDSTSVGFVLPTYSSAQELGCPVSGWQLTTESDQVIAPTNLQPPVMQGANRLVKPSDNSLH
jgi:hypothetical protein